MTPYGIPRMDEPDWVEKLGYGYTQFDHIAAAFLSIFQSVTMEGWVDIMYQCQDAFNSVGGALIFLLLILFGSFFMLNLVLAVITDCIDKQHDEDDEEQQEREGSSHEENNDEEAGKGQQKGDQEVKTDFGDPSGGSTSFDQSAATTDGGNKNKEDEDDIEKFLPTFMPPWRKRLLDFVRGNHFSNFIMGLIVLNTVILSLDKYPIQESTESTYETINLILAFAFLAEMIIKLGGMGFKYYSQDAFNLFDAFIVVMSMVEIIVAAASSGGGSSGISALRTFRIFRVFKLASKWESFQTLLSTMAKTVAEIGNFAVLLLLFMYIYSLVGMQFFANEMRFNPDTGVAIEIGHPGFDNADIPRSNFDTFLWAFTSIFQILSGENWNVIMYDGWKSTTWLSTIYFLSLVIFGGFIVMNLFLAILLSNFEGNEDLIKQEDKSSFSTSTIEEQNILVGMISKSMRQLKKSARLSIADELEENGETPSKNKTGKYKIHPMSTSSESTPPKDDQYFETDHPPQDVETSIEESEETSQLDAVDCEEPFENPNFLQSCLITMFAFHEKRKDHALYLLTKRNILREWTTTLITHPLFDNTIIVLIILSSIALAFDNPLNDPDSTLAQILVALDYIFSSIFIFEATVKILSMGFLFGDKTYLRNSWNVLDFTIVIISIIGMAGIGPGNALRALRTIRVLRPLRMISRRPELKLVVNALFASVPSIINVMVVCVLFFLIFAIVGVSRFKGTFYSCQGDSWNALSDDQQHIITYPNQFDSGNATHVSWLSSTSCSSATEFDTSTQLCQCLCGDNAWSETIPQNFDNVFMAMATLYEISTTEGWVDVMIAAVDNNGIDMQPIRDNNELTVFFFIGFMIIGSFFVMNLFVGVVIDSFNNVRHEKDGDKVFMTAEQEEWANTQKVIMKIKPMRYDPVPEEPLKKKAYLIAKAPSFEMGIMGCILLNSLVLGLQFFGQPDAYSLCLDIINYLFALIFTFEAVLKIYAFGFKKYIEDSWNIFDFTIVIGTFVGILVSVTTSTNVGPIASVVRIFRVGRIFRLINSAESLRQLFNTLITSLPSLTNIGGLLFILFFIYAVCGVQLYAKVEQLDNVTPQANFTNFWVALLTLFRFSTGENWNGFMHSLGQQSNRCENDPAYQSNWCEVNGYEAGCVPVNGCGDWTVYPFFYSFTLVVTFVMLNLFIGVILDSFSDCEESSTGGLGPSDLEEFIRVWSQYDRNANGLIHAIEFPELLQHLEPPLGFGEEYEASSTELEALVAVLAVGVRMVEEDGLTHEMVHFLDVARALAKRATIVRQGENFQELPETHTINKEWNDQVGGGTSFTLETYYSQLDDDCFNDDDERLKYISRKFSVVNPELDFTKRHSSIHKYEEDSDVKSIVEETSSQEENGELELQSMTDHTSNSSTIIQQQPEPNSSSREGSQSNPPTLPDDPSPPQEEQQEGQQDMGEK